MSANQAEESTLSKIWNSDIARHFVPDMIGVNISISKVIVLGYGVNIQGTFMLRGKNAGDGHVTWGYNGRVGKDIGGAVTIVQGWYNGDARNATFDGLLGRSADVSGGYEYGAGGGWVSFNPDFSVSWYGTAIGVGSGPAFGPKLGVSVGYGTTILIK